MILDQHELIHEESFMMGMMDPWYKQLPTFQEYLYHKLKQQKTNYFNSTSITKSVPLKDLHKELLSTTYQDNKDRTEIIEELGVVAETNWVQELLDPNKDTYPLMSESGAEQSWYGLPDDLKEAFLGFIVVDDLAESSFAGVTSQLQVFVLIGMAITADISDMDRNGFLDLPTTNTDISDKKTSLFHDFPEELQITAIMCAVQEAPYTRHSNTNTMDRQRNTKQERDKLLKQEGLEKAKYVFIQCLIYRHMWDSDRRRKTDGEVKK